MALRIGQGYDVHRLEPDRPLMLGGVRIPHERGLSGWSDADVVLHALADALLGAAGLEDLGTLFPPGDERYRDASGADLLRQVVARVDAAGYTPVQCDLTVIAEEPRLAPWSGAIRDRVAGLLGVEPGAVGFKATTQEGLGALGRGEGIAALAMVLLEGVGATPVA